jgi:NADH dehydrogenase
MAQPRVVVIGAGFGGVRVARGLRGAPVQLTVVDENNFHTFQPLLYQVATSGLDAGDISFPVRTLLRRHHGARFLMGTVTTVDLAAQTVTVGDDQLPYGYLVIAAGTVSATFGIPGVGEHTFALKAMEDAIALRSELLSRFEAASRAGAGASGQPVLRIVVVGGGPTGVEMAGGLQELIHRVLRKDFPELDVEGVPITLVEAAPRVLGPFHPTLSARAAAALTARGVEVLTGVGVGRAHHPPPPRPAARAAVAGAAVRRARRYYAAPPTRSGER